MPPIAGEPVCQNCGLSFDPNVDPECQHCHFNLKEPVKQDGYTAEDFEY